MLANIDSELSTIQNGRYGEDIRTAIKDAISKVNNAGYMPVVENLNIVENGTYTPSAGVNGFSKVVVNVPGGSGYPEPTGTISITENGTVNVKDYASANVNVQPNLQSKTVTQNGTVTADSGYDGLASVDVNVSGSGSGNISYGTSDPVPSVGSDGDVYFKYDHFIMYESLLPYDAHNLDNWQKNGAAFTKFDNTYANDENTLIQIGGNGYERIFVPVSVDSNTDYVFAMKYYSPSGVASGYGGQISFGVSFATESSMRSINSVTLDYYTNLSLTAEADYSDYSVSFNSGSNTSAYLVINLNITDGRECTLEFKDIVFYKDGEPPVRIDNDIVIGAYLKQNGVWVNAIGAILE